MAVNIKVLGVTLVKMSWGLMILVSSEFCDQLLPSFRRKHMYNDTALLCHPKKLVGYCLIDLDLAIMLFSDLLELSLKHTLIVRTSSRGSDLSLKLSYLFLEPVVLKSGFR